MCRGQNRCVRCMVHSLSFLPFDPTPTFGVIKKWIEMDFLYGLCHSLLKREVTYIPSQEPTMSWLHWFSLFWLFIIQSAVQSNMLRISFWVLNRWRLFVVYWCYMQLSFDPVANKQQSAVCLVSLAHWYASSIIVVAMHLTF